IKFFTAVTQPKIRAMWAGGGRLFVISGSTLTEVKSDTTTVNRTGTVQQGTGDPDPAQIFSNGHQLMIVSGGQVYCGNGGGPKPALFLVRGTGNLVNSNASLQWVSGPTFKTSWTGMNITINAQIYTITGVPGTGPTYTTLLLSPTPANASNVPWAISGGTQVDAQTGGFIDGYLVVNPLPRPGL